MTDVLGVLVIARNGDRTEYYQDPKTYESSYTESTALGAAESHQLGTFLRSTYMSPGSPSYIAKLKTSYYNDAGNYTDISELRLTIKSRDLKILVALESLHANRLYKAGSVVWACLAKNNRKRTGHSP
ncbi:uncharacterized protein F5147DRAFT_208596 [Suillus discolor]|uniref:Acid phosphatase n=1 Tax=Suillus discolor TaxID=1912936 RepID=A0A9P7JL47_9AGAM|nr:uncharacterized protein F5147DRAFT_208596 [Suillus discolor]KAG2082727.1 hypothetical protein F5147DRAFT_208596 [Suillus discolor]